MKNLGDKIASVATPIARGLDWAFKTNIQNCPGCKQMQQNLNQGMPFSQAVQNRFFSKQKGDKMKFIVIRQIAVEAETVEEAVEKTKQADGTTSSISVQPFQERPQPQAQTPVRPPNLPTGMRPIGT